MPSSTSSPSDNARLKLLEMHVEKNARHVRPATRDNIFVRFQLRQVERVTRPELWDCQLLLSAYIEAAPKSWITDGDRIGSTWTTHNAVVRIGVDIDGHDDPDQLMREAIAMGCRELNDPMEVAATLYGIEHNEDVHIEHKLRPGHSDIPAMGHLLQRKKPSPPFSMFPKPQPKKTFYK